MANDERSSSCQPCFKDNKRCARAVKYCINCQEFLCESCVTSHGTFSLMAGHTLQRFSGLELAGNLASLPTETCEIHRTKLVEMYCASHDVVACTVCIALKHRLCKTHYIPEYVKADTKLTVHTSLSTETSLKTLKNNLEQNRKRLEEAKKRCAQEIEDYKTELEAAIGSLKEGSIHELNMKFKEINDKVTKIDEQVDEKLKELELGNETEAAKRNISQIFVAAKVYQQKEKEIRNFLSEHENSSKYGLSFARGINYVHKYLKKRKRLGYVDILPRSYLHIFMSKL